MDFDDIRLDKDREITDEDKEAIRFLSSVPRQDNMGGRLGSLSHEETKKNMPIKHLTFSELYRMEMLAEQIGYDLDKLFENKSKFLSDGGIHFNNNFLPNSKSEAERTEALTMRFIPLSKSDIEKTIKLATYFIDSVGQDEEITEDSLDNQEQAEALKASYELIDCLYLRATNAIAPIRLSDLNTAELIDYFNKQVCNHSDAFLPYFKRYKMNKEIGKAYNVELFLFYSFIVSIGYGYTLLSTRYGTRWGTVQKHITAKRQNIIEWGDKPPVNMERLYNFATTYKPNKINQYAIKFLIDMGMSFKAINEHLHIKIDKSKKKHHYESVDLPILPIKIKK